MRLQVVDDVAVELEGVHDGGIRVELDDVESAERGGVLVLLAPFDAQVVALDLEVQLGLLVAVERLSGVGGNDPDDRRRHRRGTPQSAAGGRRRPDIQVHAPARPEAVDDRLRQVQHAVISRRMGHVERDIQAEVNRPDADQLVVSRVEGDVRVAIDRAGKDGPGMLHVPVGQVRAAPREADAQRGLRPDDRIARDRDARASRRVGKLQVIMQVFSIETAESLHVHKT